MELSDYGRILRKWKTLIIAGTIVSSFIGMGIVFADSGSSGTGYVAKSTVVLNYTQPSGTPYNPTISSRTDANLLVGSVHDPAALNGANPNLPISGVTGVSAALDASGTNVIVTATATSLASAEAAARSVSTYLADEEIGRVNVEISAQRLKYKKAVKLYHGWYTSLLAKYDRVCGCTAAGGTAKLGPVKLGNLASRLASAQTRWQNALAAIAALYNAATPPASVLNGLAKRAKSSSKSPLKTILPAAMLGFLLSAGLAAFLDFRSAGGGRISMMSGSGTPTLPRPRLPIIGQLAGPKLMLNAEIATELGGKTDVRAAVLTALARSAGETAAIASRLIQSGNATLFVTSPTVDEPKAETVVALATALSEQGNRVIVVDADPAGGVSQFFGHDSQPGLIDYLGYPEMSLANLIHPVDLGWDSAGQVAIFPLGIARSRLPDAGVFHHWSPECDSAWAAALSEMSAVADMVLVSGTPPTSFPESASMAAKCAGTLVVIRPDDSGNELTRAHTILRDHGAHVLGLVLNSGSQSLMKYSPLGARSEPESAPGVLDTGPELSEST